MQNWSRNNVDNIILVGIVILMAMPIELDCCVSRFPPNFCVPEGLVPSGLPYVWLALQQIFVVLVVQRRTTHRWIALSKGFHLTCLMG